jgi:hypothetical protein
MQHKSNLLLSIWEIRYQLFRQTIDYAELKKQIFEQICSIHRGSKLQYCVNNYPCGSEFVITFFEYLATIFEVIGG